MKQQLGLLTAIDVIAVGSKKIDRTLQLGEVLVGRPKRRQLGDAGLERFARLQHPENVVGLQFADCGGPFDELVRNPDRDDFGVALPSGPAPQNPGIGQPCHCATDRWAGYVHLSSQYSFPGQHIADLQFPGTESFDDLAHHVAGDAACANWAEVPHSVTPSGSAHSNDNSGHR